jgi:hypothetical protein
MMRASSRTRCSSSERIACACRSGRPAPEITLQLWAIESMRHSSLSDEPSGVPSSK